MCQPGLPRPHGDVPPGVLGRRLVRLPEREVARILLERARLLALLDLVGLLAREPAVVREARDPEVDVTSRRVGVTGFDQLLDEVDDLRHALRRLRQPVGHAETEVARVLEVPLRRARGELGARAGRCVVDLVVDVRDVVHELRVVARLAQPGAQPHADHERAGVPDVRPRVDRRAADVHPDRAGGCRELDDRAAVRVVEAHAAQGSARRSASSRVQRAEDGPELRPALPAGQRDPQRPQVPPHRLQLPDEGPRLVLAEDVRKRRPELREPLERLGTGRRPAVRRVEDGAGERARLDEIVGAAQERRGLHGHPRPLGQRLVVELCEHVDRQRADAVEVQVHVVLRQAELLEVRADRLGRITGLAQRRDRRPFGSLGQLLPIGADQEPVVDHLRRRRAERHVQRAVQLLVGAMIGPADHMRDPEVDVVDDARQMEGRRPFVAPQHHALEPLRQSGRARRREVPLGAVALPHGAVVPHDPEPDEVVEDRLLAPGQVAREVGVVDPQEHPVAEPPVRNCAHRVADVQRPGRAGGKTHADHGATLVAARVVRHARPPSRDSAGHSRLPMNSPCVP